MSREGRAKCATMRALARSARASGAGQGVSGRILHRRDYKVRDVWSRRALSDLWTDRLTSMCMHVNTNSLRVPRDKLSSVSASGM